MARISTYNIDQEVTINDKWIGTDFSGGVTKNFTPQKIANFFNESGLLGIANQITFKYYKTFIGSRPEGSLTTLQQDPLFSSLTSIKVSQKNSGLKFIVNMLDTFLNDTIMISDMSDPNSFGIFKLTAIEEDLDDEGFYFLSLEFIDGNGNLEDLKIYGFTSLAYGESKDKNYIHIQSLASNTWNVTHGLNKYPSVSIIDSGNNLVVGDIKYISLNEVRLTFNSSFSGKAYFN